MSKPYLAPLVRSFTEPEEDMIFNRFGTDVDELLGRGMKAGRAAIMIQHVRDGMDVGEARELVKKLTREEVDAFFEGFEPDEVLPDEPETEAGKAPTEPVDELEKPPSSAPLPGSSLPSTTD